MTARAEIENLLNRYSLAYDRNDMPAMAGTFTDDAVMSLRIGDGDLIGPFDGKEAIMKLMTDSLASQNDQRRHLVSNLVIDKETDDAATVVSYLTLISIADGKANLLSTAVYEDELTRDGGEWRFTKRHIQLDLPY
jgi:ketosteroid isomerase-like protein